MAHNCMHGFSDIQERDTVKNCCNDLQIQNQNGVGNEIEPGTGSQKSLKRNNYLSWDEYFMAIAFLSAQRSKDPKTQVGACIVNEEKKIVGIGYNGMPIGCSDDIMPWGRNPDNKLEDKHLYVCHAELNAVLNKNSADVKRCCIYVALFPCNECAKVIIQSGIKEVVYYSDKHANKDEFKVSKRLLTEAKIILRKYQPVREKILIDFSVIDEEAKANDIDRVTEDLAAL